MREKNMEERITVERAIELIRHAARPIKTEKIPIPESHGCILAEPVISPIDQPPFPRSPLDGYAFYAADSAGACGERPAILKVVETIYAGEWSDRRVERGEAVRIMTGAPIPVGCDCVVRQEDTDNGRDVVKIYTELKPWDNYCYAGEDFKKDSVLLPSGAKLNAVAMGVLASAGLNRPDEFVSVYRQLKCAVLCTGDELVPSAVRPLPAGKIYSVNETVIRGRLAELGMELISNGGQCVDETDKLAELLKEAAKSADVIFTTGGVSVGDRDILPGALSMLGAECIFKGVRMKPGSPLMFSLYKGVPILSLSGNPFAAFATFEMFGRQLLSVMTGTEELLPQVFTATLGTPFSKASKGRRFIRGTFRDGLVHLPDGHSSGQLGSAALANCLVEIHQGSDALAAGDVVKVHLL